MKCVLIILLTVLFYLPGYCETRDERVNRWLSTIPESVCSLNIQYKGIGMMVTVKGCSSGKIYTIMVGNSNSTSYTPKKYPMLMDDKVNSPNAGYHDGRYQSRRRIRTIENNSPQNDRSSWHEYSGAQGIAPYGVTLSNYSGPRTAAEIISILSYIRNNYPDSGRSMVYTAAESVTLDLIRTARELKIPELYSEFKDMLLFEANARVDGQFSSTIEARVMFDYVDKTNPSNKEDLAEFFKKPPFNLRIKFTEKVDIRKPKYKE